MMVRQTTMYSMEMDPVGLQFGVWLAVAVLAGFGHTWRSKYFWGVGAALAGIPLSERWLMHWSMAASTADPRPFDTARQVTLWAVFYVVPIGLVFSWARASKWSSRTGVAIVAGVSYAALAIIGAVVLVAFRVIQP